MGNGKGTSANGRMISRWLGIKMRANGYRVHDFCPTCGVTPLVKELGTDAERFYINARVLQDVDFSSLKHEECDPLSVLRKKAPSSPEL